jgi:hypothetical protein
VWIVHRREPLIAGVGLHENTQMIPQSCLLIESKKFPIQPGEDQEITNERMYGKALCTYLQEHLPRAGVNVPFFCNEDWGWWLEVEHGDFKMALCIYSDPDAEGNPEKYGLMPSIDKETKWSWSRFRKVDVSNDVLAVIDIVERTFAGDKDVSAVTRHNDFPF